MMDGNHRFWLDRLQIMIKIIKDRESICGVSDLNISSLELYHGSMKLNGEKITIQSGSGVGWNSMTLGDAFYTTLNPDAARPLVIWCFRNLG